MVAITSIKSAFLPLNSRKEKENAAKEQEIICPAVISPAVINVKRPAKRENSLCQKSLDL